MERLPRVAADSGLSQPGTKPEKDYVGILGAHLYSYRYLYSLVHIAGVFSRCFGIFFVHKSSLPLLFAVVHLVLIHIHHHSINPSLHSVK